MNKGMILDVAAETIGSEWARNRAALKKTELVAAAAAAFRPDPARDPARDARSHPLDAARVRADRRPVRVRLRADPQPPRTPAPGQTGLIRQA